MVNYRLMRNALEDKFSNQFFHAIVHECFINALPIDKTEMTDEEDKRLRYYTHNVVQSIGGIKALEHAIDINHKTPAQNLFLGGLYGVCTEAAKKCTDEKCKDPDLCKKDDKLDDILQKSTLTDQECKTFANKANSMKLDDVAEIIKKKTLNVIKDEKDQYKKEKELDEELEDAIKDEDNEDIDDVEESSSMGENNPNQNPDISPDKRKAEKAAKSATESILDICLDGCDPRHHVSMFSKLQDTAMEMMEFTNVAGGTDYFPIVYNTTFESFFDKPEGGIKKPAIEASIAASEEICEVPRENRPKYATLVSIIVYTIMETLHTMGIHTPAKEAIQSFVSSPVSSKKVISKNMNETSNSIKKAVNEAALLDFSKMNKLRLGNTLESLKTTLEQTEEFMSEFGASTEMIEVASEATKYIQEINEINHQRLIDHNALTEASESMVTKRQKANDVAQFNKISNMFTNNPQVNEIQLVVDPDGMTSIIDVKCANEAGQIIRNSFMHMEYACESDHYLDYLTDTFDKSKLSQSMKNVVVLINDGRGTRYNLQ